MSTLFKVKDTVYMGIGIVLVLFAALILLFAGFHLNVPDKREVALNALGLCTPMVLVPGIAALYFGYRAYRRRKDYEELASYLRAYRRIKIPSLAKKLNVSEFEAERRILKCVRLKFLTGFIDRASDEFFNPKGMEGKVLVSCPNCGGSVEQMVLAGETGKCPYCGSNLG